MAPKPPIAKIVSRDQALWETVKRNAEVTVKQCEDELKVQSEIVKMADEKIKEEKNRDS